MGIFSGGEVSRDEFDRLLRRVEELEHRLASALARGQVVVAPTPGQYADTPVGPDLTKVIDLNQRGKRIEAIKAYRELTGAGLKEAKDAVERL